MSAEAESWQLASMSTPPTRTVLAPGAPVCSRLARVGALAAVLLAPALTVTAGCGGGGHDEQEKPSGAICPTTQTLTYANFAGAFFEQYCQRCHAGTVTGAARNGAPDDHTFDTVTDIVVNKTHIDENAAAGPKAVNKTMPPNGAKPTDEERRKLGEWLACGAPP
jgi:uncharacterized membrane protein